jgi:hypothetical protein
VKMDDAILILFFIRNLLFDSKSGLKLI